MYTSLDEKAAFFWGSQVIKKEGGTGLKAYRRITITKKCFDSKFV